MSAELGDVLRSGELIVIRGADRDGNTQELLFRVEGLTQHQGRFKLSGDVMAGPTENRDLDVRIATQKAALEKAAAHIAFHHEGIGGLFGCAFERGELPKSSGQSSSAFS